MQLVRRIHLVTLADQVNTILENALTLTPNPKRDLIMSSEVRVLSQVQISNFQIMLGYQRVLYKVTVTTVHVVEETNLIVLID